MDKDLVIIGRAGGVRELKRGAWGRVLECWRQSGLEATEFSLQHGIKAGLLFTWRAKLQQPSPPATGGSFAELEVLPGCPSIEIHLGLARVLLPFDGTAQRLSMILQAVREAAC